MTDTFHAVTPLGTVSFEFGGWPGARMNGDPAATRYMRQVISQCSGEDGRGIAVETMDPSDLIGFCQPAWSGVTVIPPADMLFEQQNPGTENILDGVGDVASAASIRAEIMVGASVAQRLAAARRLVGARAVEPPSFEMLATFQAGNGTMWRAGRLRTGKFSAHLFDEDANAVVDDTVHIFSGPDAKQKALAYAEDQARKAVASDAPDGAATQRATDLELLSKVSAGTHPDMLEPELADQIEAALSRHPNDAEVAAAAELAIIAYSNGLLAAT